MYSQRWLCIVTQRLKKKKLFYCSVHTSRNILFFSLFFFSFSFFIACPLSLLSPPFSSLLLVATFADLAYLALTHLVDPLCTAQPTPAHRWSRLAQSPQTHLTYSNPSRRCHPSLFSLYCDWVFCVCVFI